MTDTLQERIAKLREALEIGKLLAIRHGHEHDTAPTMIRKIDDGREAIITIESQLTALREEHELIKGINETVVGEFNAAREENERLQKENSNV